MTIPIEVATRIQRVLRELGSGLGEIEQHLSEDEVERSRLLSGEFTGELFALASGVEAAISEAEVSL